VSPPPASLLTTPRILWLALLASQVIYVVLLVVPGLLSLPEEPADPSMLPLLIGIAGADAIGSFVLPAFLRRKAAAAAAIPIADVPDPDAPTGFRGVAPTIRTYVNRSAARRTAIQIGFAPFIIALALSEAITVMGFLLGFLGFPPLAWAPFFAVGMALTAARFPTERMFFAPIERHTGVRLGG
jgi:hypothetical protein